MKRLHIYIYCCLSVVLLVYSSMAYAGDTKAGGNIPGKDSLYIQIYGGINKSANENLPMSEFSFYPLSGGFFIGIGKEVNALWGWRTALRYNHNKSRNVPECESPDTWGWNNIGLFVDATFDITDALKLPVNRGTRFNLKAFAGIGGVYTFGFPMQTPLSYSEAYSRNSTVGFGMRAGLTATYLMSHKWRIGAELSQTMFNDKFNGVKSGSPFDGRSNLKVGVTYLFGKKKKVKTDTSPIIYDNRLRDIPALPFKIPGAEDTKNRAIEGRAFLDFPVNETVIYPRYRRNPEELQRLNKTIENALFDKSFKVHRVVLHGYASPESPYSNNTRLAKGRTQSLKSYVCRKFGIDEFVVETHYTPEDWDNLRSFIETCGESRRVKGNVWYERESIVETPVMPQYVIDSRKELLDVIDLDISPDEKEAMLKKVDNGRPYNWLLQNVYPGLRHTDYIIEYVARPFNAKESRRLIYTHPEALSIEEMYKVAQTYEEGSDGWLDALLIAANLNPEDKTANLNAACGCVKTKRLTDARRYLKKAGTTPQANYLRDVIDAMEGKKAWKIENEKVIVTEDN